MTAGQDTDVDPGTLTQTSKFLSLVLRHDPGAIGITLDPQGWIDIDILLQAMANAGRPTTRAVLVALVNSPGKKRLVFDDSGQRIRAAQGHSIDVDLGYKPVVPPAALYHGTADRNLASIMANGLKPGARHDVHLSADTETALTVGRRHGKPVVLRVDAEAMARDGHVFHRADNGVWLTRSVPPRFLEVVA